MFALFELYIIVQLTLWTLELFNLAFAMKYHRSALTIILNLVENVWPRGKSVKLGKPLKGNQERSGRLECSGSRISQHGNWNKF